MTRTSEAGRYTCDCGCGGELSEAAVAIGRRFLRGHKPVPVARISREIRRRAPRTGPGEEITADGVAKFAVAQVALLRAQVGEDEATLARVTARLGAARCQLDAWTAVSEALAKRGAGGAV
jgi:hypothetical protein